MDLRRACEDGDLATLKQILEADQNPDIALLEAVKTGHLDCVIYLIKQGANVNYIDPDNKASALICALLYPLIVSLLLKHGANVNYTRYVDGRTMTALEYALMNHDASKKTEESARILLEAGATYDNRNRKLSSVWFLNRLETEIQHKQTRCGTTCGVILFCFRRRGAPHDMARYFVTSYVRDSWREEKWLK